LNNLPGAVTETPPASDPVTAPGTSSSLLDRSGESLSIPAEPTRFDWSTRYDATIQAASLEPPAFPLSPPSIESQPPAQIWPVVREILETFILALTIFLLVRVVVINFRVQGSSMEPSLQDNQYLIVNRLTYSEALPVQWLRQTVGQSAVGGRIVNWLFHGPERGDVVVFLFPRDPTRDFVKRVIALPGETVEIRNGQVFIDGRLLFEPYITDPWFYSFGPQTVGPKEIFVLGDNRNNSSDSHSWGMLPRANLVGKAWISYWPPSTWGIIPSVQYNLP